MSESTLVKFKIIASTGFSVHEKPAGEALDVIKAYLEEHGGNLYLSGQTVNVDFVKKEELEDASLIVVGHVVMGGDE